MADNKESTDGKKWDKIHAEIRDMIVCCNCDKQVYTCVDNVVLACSHSICIVCLTELWTQSQDKSEIECPKCASTSEVPSKKGILGFPYDCLSSALRTHFLNEGDKVSCLSRCRIHPKKELTGYCTQCSVSVCEFCCDKTHNSHKVETLVKEAEKMKLGAESYISALRKMSSVFCEMSHSLQAEKTKMLSDITELSADQQDVQRAEVETANLHEKCGKIVHTIEFLENQKKQLLEEPLFREAEPTSWIGAVDFGLSVGVYSARKNIISRLSDLIVNLNQDLSRLKDVQREPPEGVDKVEANHQLTGSLQTELVDKFEHAHEQLKAQRDSFEHEEKFIHLLLSIGNNSDIVARLPGIKSLIERRRHFSGEKYIFKTLKWKPVDRTRCDDLNTFSKAKVSESLNYRTTFANSVPHGICTASLPCKPARNSRGINLFNRHYILHVDKSNIALCLHKISGAVITTIPVRGIQYCAAPIIVDPLAAELVVADEVRPLQEEEKEHRSSEHLSGTLHWLTINEEFQVTSSEITQLQCVQAGSMKVNTSGNLVLLTGCSSGKHQKQILVYNNKNKKTPVCTVQLGRTISSPVSAVNSGPDKFVVVDWDMKQVLWVDQKGKVLGSYGKGHGEKMNGPSHVQPAQDCLLVTELLNSRVNLFNTNGKFLCHLLQESEVKHPRTLHLDEKAGLLFVVQGNHEMDRSVKTFKFAPIITQITELGLSFGM